MCMTRVRVKRIIRKELCQILDVFLYANLRGVVNCVVIFFVKTGKNFGKSLLTKG